uniref:Uncharacterized protein n=1 Tax=Amphimedon queenslandica TaxID=400682 RepID=A0A1X7VPM4_AMPQE
ALTYWEEEAPSRLDLGKDKYGGPFTEEEVEDVKTVFRLLLLFHLLVIKVCCYKYIPGILKLITFGQMFTILTLTTSLEFTIAQSPVNMRGVMVGMWFASLGCGYLFNINIKYLFHCHNEYLCTAPYYYLTKSAVVFAILILFVILAKNYKYRVRENEVNVHLIVDDHYQRYIEQEEEHNVEFSH